MAGLSDLSIHASGWSVCLCDASVSAYGWMAVTRLSLPMAVSVVTRLSVSDSPVCLCLSLSVMTRLSVSAYGWLSL